MPRNLNLAGNAISVLPAGIFDQLSSLGCVGERGGVGVWGHGRRGRSVWERVWLGVVLPMCMSHPCLYVSLCVTDVYAASMCLRAQC